MDKDNMNKNQATPEKDAAPVEVKPVEVKKKTTARKGHKFMHMKQLRYGSLSVVLTVVAILLVMAVNWAFGAIEDRFACPITRSSPFPIRLRKSCRVWIRT